MLLHHAFEMCIFMASYHTSKLNLPHNMHKNGTIYIYILYQFKKQGHIIVDIWHFGLKLYSKVEKVQYVLNVVVYVLSSVTVCLLLWWMVPF